MPTRLRSVTEYPWFVPLVLALPFLVTVAVLRGMTATLPIFHGSDELVYHYPTILRFSHELPFPDLHSYHAAQTPLYHLLMAYIGKVTGYQLWRLRLVQVVISYGLALAVFVLLSKRLRMDRLQALAMTLLFVLSPYVFGQSFRLGTDNLALLFSILAIERLERFRECDRIGPFLAACALIAAAMLTRQSAAFLVPVAVLYALRPGAKLSAAERALALAAVVLSVVPVGLLFLNWHGLIPVGGDPGSCGLCAKGGSGGGLTLGGLEVQTMELTLASIGIYGTVLFAPEWIPSVRALLIGPDRVRRIAAAVRAPLLAALAGAVLLALFPATPGSEAAGDVWKVAAHLPSIHGSSLLFWVLVPLACAVLWLRLARAPRPWLVAVVAGCFLIAAIAIRYPWQKYVDPFALLILLFTLRTDELRSRRRLAGAAVLVLAFLAYTIDYSSHKSTPHPASAAATPATRSA